MNETLFRLINNLAGRFEFIDQLMVFSADRLGYLLVIILGLIALKNFKKYAEMAALALGSAIVARFGIALLIKSLYDHPRPYWALASVHLLGLREVESSFPSGHASFYFAFATVVFLYSRRLGYWFFAAALLMSFARVYIGVHWPFDILAGAVIGVAVAVVGEQLYKKYKHKLALLK